MIGFGGGRGEKEGTFIAPSACSYCAGECGGDLLDEEGGELGGWAVEVAGCHSLIDFLFCGVRLEHGCGDEVYMYIEVPCWCLSTFRVRA